MSVVKLESRKQGARPDLDLLDDLDTEIRFVQCIELAIIGESEICDFDCSDLVTLTTLHKQRLQAIKARVARYWQEG